MQNQEGEWKNGSGGTYYLDSNSYVETHSYNNNVGTAAWNYDVRGDSLFMEGPTFMIDAEGNKTTEDMWHLDEIRVRAE